MEEDENENVGVNVTTVTERRDTPSEREQKTRDLESHACRKVFLGSFNCCSLMSTLVPTSRYFVPTLVSHLFALHSSFRSVPSLHSSFMLYPSFFPFSLLHLLFHVSPCHFHQHLFRPHGSFISPRLAFTHRVSFSPNSWLQIVVERR